MIWIELRTSKKLLEIMEYNIRFYSFFKKNAQSRASSMCKIVVSSKWRHNVEHDFLHCYVITDETLVSHVMTSHQ